MEERGAAIPALVDGERMDRPTFEARFDATPGLKFAELIEGVVRFPVPASFRKCSEARFDLIGWCAYYTAYTPGLKGSAHGHIRFDEQNILQPTATVFVNPVLGGQVRISADDYLEGVPEWILEVGFDSLARICQKLGVYQDHGVREVLIAHLAKQSFYRFGAQDGRFELLETSCEGILRSEVYPGLWLDPVAMLTGNMPRVFEVVRQGLASPEHAAFVEQLRQRAAAAQEPAR